MGLIRDFWAGRRVLVTGHTGFKGSWLSMLLERLGSRVFGLALPPHTKPSLFEAASPWPTLKSTFGDIRSQPDVRQVIGLAQPDIVMHLASLSTVQAAYEAPAVAFATNVTGTVNLMEALRELPSPPSAILVVTTDKVYETSHSPGPFSESDPLGGTSPYSASKVGQESVAATYRKHYFDPSRTRVATARGGNVIGGGDWSQHRIVPDYMRAVDSGLPLKLRHPDAVRPWQFVLDVLVGYLLYVQALSRDEGVPSTLNFGPLEEAPVSVAQLIRLLSPEEPLWIRDRSALWAEEPALRLSANRAVNTLDWKPMSDLRRAAALTAEWYAKFRAGADARDLTMGQIDDFLEQAT